MLVECHKCGAPLDVQASSNRVKCRYCGVTTELERTKTIAVQTPAGWQPPPVWTPPRAPQGPPPVALRYRRTGTGSPIVAAVISVVALAGVGSSVLATTGGVDIPFFSKGDRWDGTSTLVCALNETLVVDGKDANVAFGPVIDAAGPNCRLTIRNCHLHGAIGVQGGVNAEITIENSTIDATDRGVAGDMNMTVHVRGQSRITAALHGIAGGTNAHIDIDGPSTISAVQGDGVRGDTNLELLAHATTIEGGTAGVAGGLNPHVHILQATVRGRQAAFNFAQNAEVDLTGATVEGERQLGRNARISER